MRGKPWCNIAGMGSNNFFRFHEFKANQRNKIWFWKDGWVGGTTLEMEFPVHLVETKSFHS